MVKNYRNIAKTALFLVYLVIIAGGIVRMTGSGMGCPDWPKCFGYYIPPTEKSELLWQSEKEYKKGQVIIKNENLLVSLKDFTTSTSFEEGNWAPYTKHDYSIFNPWHTWIEFINRLFGALAGLATLVLALISLAYWKRNKWVTVLSWLVVFAMGFQAWLGATVVYSVLEPVKITIHMVMALVIVAMLLYVIHLSRNRTSQFKYDRTTFGVVSFALLMTLIQIIMGTQVRQFVDERIDMVGEAARQLWLQDASLQFYIHRSFSILVVLVNLYLGYRIYRLNLGLSKINWVLGLLLLEVITGMAMYYWDFPFASQPLHLILASLLFGVQFYLVLESKGTKKAVLLS